MASGPSKAAETIVGILTPPACREEVLGDLYERYRSPLQYGFDALGTVPLVILSRIRRTADPQVLVMQAFALYLSFLTAARFEDESLLQAQWGLLRLAIPPGMTLLGLVLEDAYATPGQRSAPGLVRGPLIGLGLALAIAGHLGGTQSGDSSSGLDFAFRVRDELAALFGYTVLVSAPYAPASGSKCSGVLAEAIWRWDRARRRRRWCRESLSRPSWRVR